MTAEELMTIANMGKGTDMSSYEHFMMAEKSARLHNANSRPIQPFGACRNHNLS